MWSMFGQVLTKDKINKKQENQVVDKCKSNILFYPQPTSIA